MDKQKKPTFLKITDEEHSPVMMRMLRNTMSSLQSGPICMNIARERQKELMGASKQFIEIHLVNGHKNEKSQPGVKAVIRPSVRFFKGLTVLKSIKCSH